MNKFRPTPDITALELAEILAAGEMAISDEVLDSLSEASRRHFKQEVTQ